MDGAGLGQATWAALSREKPDRSARRRVTFVQALWIVAFGGFFYWAARAHPAFFLAALHVAALLLFSLSISWRLVAAAASLARTAPAPPPPSNDTPIYTILCPLYRETAVVPALIAALERIDYPGT